MEAGRWKKGKTGADTWEEVTLYRTDTWPHLFFSLFSPLRSLSLLLASSLLVSSLCFFPPLFSLLSLAPLLLVFPWVGLPEGLTEVGFMGKGHWCPLRGASLALPPFTTDWPPAGPLLSYIKKPFQTKTGSCPFKIKAPQMFTRRFTLRRRPVSRMQLKACALPTIRVFLSSALTFWSGSQQLVLGSQHTTRVNSLKPSSALFLLTILLWGRVCRGRGA